MATWCCCDAAAAPLVGGVVVEVALHSYDYFWKKVDEKKDKSRFNRVYSVKNFLSLSSIFGGLFFLVKPF